MEYPGSDNLAYLVSRGFVTPGVDCDGGQVHSIWPPSQYIRRAPQALASTGTGGLLIFFAVCLCLHLAQDMEERPDSFVTLAEVLSCAGKLQTCSDLLVF